MISLLDMSSSSASASDWSRDAARLAAWVRDGKLRYREDILDGIESCPDAIAGLYRGENMGKRIIRLRP